MRYTKYTIVLNGRQNFFLKWCMLFIKNQAWSKRVKRRAGGILVSLRKAKEVR